MASCHSFPASWSTSQCDCVMSRKPVRGRATRALVTLATIDSRKFPDQMLFEFLSKCKTEQRAFRKRPSSLPPFLWGLYLRRMQIIISPNWTKLCRGNGRRPKEGRNFATSSSSRIMWQKPNGLTSHWISDGETWVFSAIPTLPYLVISLYFAAVSAPSETRGRTIEPFWGRAEARMVCCRLTVPINQSIRS